MTADKLAHFQKMLLDEKTRIEADRDAYIRDDRAARRKMQPSELSHNDSQ